MRNGKVVQLPLFEEALHAYEERAAAQPERPVRFMTTSSEPIQRLYTPADAPEADYMQKVGFPGQWPYTRGVHATGYRGRLWTMRMFAGFGNAEETNARFKYLLANGNTGLSVAFDMPTLYGYDTDDPKAEGEFGTCGVAVSSLADMEILFSGIPLDEITTSMTINSPAPMIWAMYLVNAEKRGVPLDRLSGTTQNDILKEYIAQKEYIYPPRPSTKLVVDTFQFGAEHVPRWNTISISGYHIREAGATALQELAFTLADGIQYVQSAVDAGLDVDSFAPRLSFFFDVHNDLLEEVAKLRAARRIWARLMRDRFGAQQERSLWCRFHCQTAGVSLFVEQPENNIVRTTIQALAAVLGGTQSLHTNSMDEAMALPSEKAARIALRTQQIIAYESGVANTAWRPAAWTTSGASTTWAACWRPSSAASRSARSPTRLIATSRRSIRTSASWSASTIFSRATRSRSPYPSTPSPARARSATWSGCGACGASGTRPPWPMLWRGWSRPRATAATT
jgi:methylmalonyl-CoA mutase N-terminal domain/subunit